MSARINIAALLAVLQFTQSESVRKVLASFDDAAVFHPGHPPHHVTRLHRYEHMGLQSMLQEEARWTNGLREHAARAEGEMQGSSLLEAVENSLTVSDHTGFVKLSDIQSQALQEHHRSWLSWLKASGMEDKSLNSNSIPTAALLQKFKAYMTSYRQNHSGQDVIATRLSRLSSQYVGPVGIGTVVSPAGCSLKAEATPVAEDISQRDGIGSFVSSVKAHDASTMAQTCTISDQSKIWVVYDTGSTNIWISSDLCKSGPCQLAGRHTFNHSASATFRYPESMLQLTVQFGTGKITGPQAVDDFHIGPFTVYNQTFAMIETENGSVFNDVPFEGIVGMAFDRMSANHVRPFFSSIIEQRAMKHNEFAFYFSHDKPSANALFWGGVDKSFYEGNLQYFPVIDPFYWSLKLVSFKIGGDSILGSDSSGGGSFLQNSRSGVPRSNNPERTWNGPVAIVDTGTTFFTAESGKFSEVMSKLPPAACKDVNDQSHPPITISLENTLGSAQDFVLTNKQYMSQSSEAEDARCSPAFMQIDLPEEHGPGMILGEIFLRHYFAVFDRDDGKDANAKVAFAKSANSPETLKRLQEITQSQPTFDRNQ